MRFNQVVLCGRLTCDPELKYAPSGTEICEMGIAFDQGTKDNKKTGYVNITVFGKSGEACHKYLSKGSPVLIGGRLDHQQWETEDGSKRSTLKVIAHDVQFLDTKKKEGVDGAAGTEGGSKAADEW